MVLCEAVQPRCRHEARPAQSMTGSSPPPPPLVQTWPMCRPTLGAKWRRRERCARWLRCGAGAAAGLHHEGDKAGCQQQPHVGMPRSLPLHPSTCLRRQPPPLETGWRGRDPRQPAMPGLPWPRAQHLADCLGHPQAVVDAVVALLESGALLDEEATAHEAAQPTVGAAQTAALHFLATHLASNRAAVSGAVLLRVLEHLAAPPAPGAAARAGGMSPAQREAVFCDVVSAAGAGMSVPDQQQVGRRHRAVGCRGWLGRQRKQLRLGSHTPACCTHCLLLAQATWLANTPPCPASRPASWRGAPASCKPRRGCGMPRGGTPTRWPAWHEMRGEDAAGPAPGSGRRAAWVWCTLRLVHRLLAPSWPAATCVRHCKWQVSRRPCACHNLPLFLLTHLRPNPPCGMPAKAHYACLFGSCAECIAISLSLPPSGTRPPPSSMCVTY